MTLAEAILEVERRFTVHHEVGCPSLSYDQQDKEIDTGARDMSRAPCGEPYFTVTSGGIREAGSRVTAFYTEKSRAIAEWQAYVFDLAAELAPADKWKSLHLYWRTKPEYDDETYVALDQAGILQRHPDRADILHINVGVVWSTLLITKTGPDGEEADV